LLRRESFDEDPLAGVAPRLDERRDAAAPRVVLPRALVVPGDRLEPDDRLSPEDRLEPDDPLEPEDFARVDLLAVPLAARLARPAPLDAAFAEPAPRLDAAFVEPPPRLEAAFVEPAPRLEAAFVEPAPRLEAAFVEPPPRLEAALAAPPLPLLGLAPVVFRPVCFGELLVVATSPPFPGLVKRYPLVRVR
jgi:hypothetical protein